MKLEEVKEYIANSSQESEIFIGCDSQVYGNKKTGKRSVTYALVVVIHNIEGGTGYGCKLFKEVRREELHYKPSIRQRLMQEVYYSGDLAMKLAEVVGDRPFSIHMDVNPNEKEKSHVVINEAIGYVRSLGITPVVKPDSVAANTAADRFAHSA